MIKSKYIFLITLLSLYSFHCTFGQTNNISIKPFTNDDIEQITYSPDGNIIATSQDGVLRIWDYKSGQIIRQMNDNKFEAVTLAPIRRVFFVSPTVIGLLGFRELRLFDVGNGKLLRTDTTGTPRGISISSNKKFVIKSVSGQTEITSLITGKTVATLPYTFEEGYEVSNDGSFLYRPNGNKIEKLLLPIGKLINTYSSPSAGIIKNIRLSTDEKIILGFTDEIARIWENQSGNYIKGLRIDSYENVELTQDATILATLNKRTVELRGLESTFKPHLFQIEGEGNFNTIAFSPISKRLLFAEGNQMYERDILTGNITNQYGGKSDQYVSACFSPDGSILLLGTSDGYIKWIDIRTGTYQGVYRKLDKPALFLQFNKDGKELEIGDGSSVDIVHVKTGDLLRTYSEEKYRQLGLRVSKTGMQLHLLTDKCVFINKLKILTLLTKRGDNLDFLALDSRTGLFDGTSDGITQLGLWSLKEQTLSPEQLKNRFYKPRMLQSWFTDGAILQSAPTLTSIEAHPIVTLSPLTNKVKINVINRGGGIGRIEVYLNQKLIIEDARTTITNDIQSLAGRPSIEIALDLKKYLRFYSGEENLVEVAAYNQSGSLISPRIPIALLGTARGAGETPLGKVISSKSNAQPELWALIVGVSEYSESTLFLPFAAKDADNIYQGLEVGSKQFFNNRVHLFKLTSTNQDPALKPTASNIRRVLKDIQPNRNDVLLIYLAGHGVSSTVDETYHFLTAEATSLNSVNMGQSILDSELRTLLQTSQCNKQILILDACYSGRVIDKIQARSVLGNADKALDLMKDRAATYILASSSSSQQSWESYDFQQGLLTHFLLEAMRGGALDPQDGKLEVTNWLQYSRRGVEEYTRREKADGRTKITLQIPQFASLTKLNDFWIAKYPDQLHREQVPISQPLPVVSLAQIRDEQLSDRFDLQKQLNEVLMTNSLGRPFYGIEINDYPESYRLSGSYTYKNDSKSINLLMKVFKGKEEKISFVVSGDTDSVIRQTISRFSDYCKKLSIPKK
ncbi:caspase family protein [Spirosoma radiotolerans]|uniref:Peptidase C14 caspase domain-containing protein n=1 Tax=Spirosoma radiotolerans TaxID=1379870 RepID=A0A0E3ZYS0_9BACT|nr:caspase family protein [Spirosoma radiotolerans]AKD56974.1 hypothetical protein SD10_20785 [Spirosoma radiotolerans]